MLASTARRCAGFAWQLRYLSSVAQKHPEALQQLQRVQQALEDALEGVSYVRESAHQAFLETEPDTRATTEEYMMRYQTFARDELNRALQQHQQLLEQIGEKELTQLQNGSSGLQLTYADSLLAREKLNAALRRNAEKVADRASLTSRPEHQAGYVNKDPCKPAWELPD